MAVTDTKEVTTTSSSEALGKLTRGISSSGSLSFPEDLSQHAVIFQVKKRERDTVKKTTSTRNGSAIALPIPANLATGYNAQYSQTGLGVLGNAAQDLMAGNQVNAQSLRDLIQTEGGNLVSEQAKAIAADASVEVAALLGGLVAGPAGLGVGAAAAGIARGALAGARLAVNPHLAVLFEGVGFRNHSFQYKFAARSQSESNTLKSIIKVFKTAMVPSLDNLAFFNYPDEFDITFPGKEEFLFKIGTSVLTDFQINYTPDGASYFHSNGAPVSVTLSMAFTEIDILTKKEIEDGF